MRLGLSQESGTNMALSSMRAAATDFAGRHRAAVGFAAGIGVCAVLTAGGVALASVPSPSGVFDACVSKATGSVRLIDVAKRAKCGTTETAVSWSRGYRYKGAWNTTASYAVGDIVTSRGSSYVALVASRRVTPVAGRTWGLLAPAGVSGPAGATGPVGATGPAGALGATGPAGAPGAKGSSGPAGVLGLPKYTRVNGTAVPISGNTAGTAVVDCPAGTVILSGGFISQNFNLRITDSYPFGTTQWFVSAKNEGANPFTLQAFALCA